MNFYKTEAIVLRDYDLGEQDKIVLFYSRKYGKIKTVVKGARRIKSRFSSAIQPPSYDTLVVYKSRRGDLDTLSECKIKHPFLKIRKSLVRFAYSSYLAELIIKLTEEGEPCAVLFYLLLKSLFLLERISEPHLHLLIHSFELKLLDILGYRPSLEKCVNCGKKMELIKSPHLSIRLGGILCEACQKEDKKGLVVSKKLIKLMEHLLYLRLERACQLKVNEDMEGQLEMVLESHLSHHLRGEMATPLFIRNFERLELGKKTL